MTDRPAPAEFVAVPAELLGSVIDTHIGQLLRGDLPNPKVQAAFAELFPGGGYRDLPGLVRISAEAAFWLAFHADPFDLYGLDEASDEAYRRPEVAAQAELQRLVEDQAPATDARLMAEVESEIDALSSLIKAHRYPATEVGPR